MTRAIALMNQKGGVGKTTTTVNLGVGLARKGKKVLLLDLDPQAHTSTHLGIDESSEKPTMYDVLVRNKDILQCQISIESNLSIVASNIDLAGAEVELSGVVAREMILRDALEQVRHQYDYILMDCPPSLGVLTLNALTASNEVIVPLQPHFLALHGLSKLFETVQLVAKRLNPPLIISGVVLCLYDTGARLAKEVHEDLKAFLKQSRRSGMDLPWKNTKLYERHIRRNIRLAEASSFGQSIFDYDPECNGSKDYEQLTQEVVAQEELGEGSILKFSKRILRLAG